MDIKIEDYLEEQEIKEICKDALYQKIREDMRGDVIDAPAVDVAPVVRCNDCKYWQDNNDGYPHEECRWGNGETPDPDDFCSYGELKEGAD